MTSLRKLLLVYGDSILLSGISDFVRSRTDIKVVLLNKQEGIAAILDIKPDLIIVDDAQTTSRQVNELITAFPANARPIIIRMNGDSQQLTTTSSQQFPASSTDELIQAIQIILG